MVKLSVTNVQRVLSMFLIVLNGLGAVDVVCKGQAVARRDAQDLVLDVGVEERPRKGQRVLVWLMLCTAPVDCRLLLSVLQEQLSPFKGGWKTNQQGTDVVFAFRSVPVNLEVATLIDEYSRFKVSRMITSKAKGAEGLAVVYEFNLYSLATTPVLQKADMAAKMPVSSPIGLKFSPKLSARSSQATQVKRRRVLVRCRQIT